MVISSSFAAAVPELLESLGLPQPTKTLEGERKVRHGPQCGLRIYETTPKATAAHGSLHDLLIALAYGFSAWNTWFLGFPNRAAKKMDNAFADIKGSMELIEDLDPEDARAIVDSALN